MGIINIPPKMKAVNRILIDECEGMNHCICALGRNIVVEVPRQDCAKVVGILKGSFEDVVDIRKAYLMIDDLHDFILVKPMITEAPLFDAEGVLIPRAEKLLVDLYADKEYSGVSTEQKAVRARELLKCGDFNPSKVMRYASRKGKKEEMSEWLALLLEEGGHQAGTISGENTA